MDARYTSLIINQQFPEHKKGRKLKSMLLQYAQAITGMIFHHILQRGAIQF